MWTLDYDGGVRFTVGTTNMAESYIVILKDAKNLPIASLLKKILYNYNEMWNK